MYNLNQGQTLTEFAFLALIASTVLTVAALLLRTAWFRGECAYFVFETTHARLMKRDPPQSKYFIKIQKLSDRVRGSGQCQNIRETVELPLLESAKW